MWMKSSWPAVMLALLAMTVSVYTLDDADMEEPYEQQTEDLERDLKDPAFSYKIVTTSTTTAPVTNATKRPLQCFFCSYDSKMPRLRTCLDPMKFVSSMNVTLSSSNVTTTWAPYSSVYKMMTKICHSVDDKCFTSAVLNATHETVHRGCSLECVPSLGTSCCESDRCNMNPVLMPERFEKVAVRTSGTTKSTPFSIFFIVTIMLVLHTAVRVAFV